MNLTTVKPGPETVVRHYCESLFFAAHLPAEKPALSVIDAGSGAGFPGVPMAILRPGWKVTLVESNQRKAVFLRESTRNMTNIVVLGERIERLSDNGDWIVARAVESREILKNVPRLAPKVGLMLSDTDFSSIRRDSRIAWAEPIQLPWGDRKVCAYGTFHVERST
jgi:16S rRNA (guanine(527)-N(7))-methyltransferase RsmG